MRQPFSGTAERIFMKLLPNDTGEMELQRRATVWRMSCRRLRNDSELVYAGLCWFGIVRPRRLRYKIMSARMHLI